VGLDDLQHRPDATVLAHEVLHHAIAVLLLHRVLSMRREGVRERGRDKREEEGGRGKEKKGDKENESKSGDER
jgi:hypothetical protein